MRLADRAGTADDRRHIGQLKLARLGGERHGDRAIRVRGFQSENLGDRPAFRLEPWNLDLRQGFDKSVLSVAREFWGRDTGGVLLKPPERQILFNAGESAKLPPEGAKLGENIPRGSALDRAHMDGGG